MLEDMHRQLQTFVAIEKKNLVKRGKIFKQMMKT